MLDLFDGPVATQQALRLLEEKCRSGVFSSTLSTDELRLSVGACALLGISAKGPSLGISSLHGMLHPEDRLAPSEFESCLAAGVPCNREVRIIRQDGRMRWLAAFVEFVLEPNGAPLKMVGVINDVTERHEADHALVASQSRFRDLVMGVAPVVWVADAKRHGDGGSRVGECHRTSRQRCTWQGLA